jgi:hypothetical protein
MKVRLIKMNVDGWKHYYLKNEEGKTIGSTNYPFPPESLLLANHYGITLQKLSRDNCEAIELGYDLNKLAEEWIDYNGEKWSNNNNEVGDNYGSFKAGFQTAVEILANNKFTAEDMSTMLLNTTDWMNEQSPDWDANKLLTETIKSLQPNSWDVEIEMDEMNHNMDEMDYDMDDDEPIYEFEYDEYDEMSPMVELFVREAKKLILSESRKKKPAKTINENYVNNNPINDKLTEIKNFMHRIAKY